VATAAFAQHLADVTSQQHRSIAGNHNSSSNNNSYSNLL